MSEVRRGCSTERFSEHRNESAWSAVSGFESGIRNLRSLCQQAHGLHEAELLPPFPERHAGFLLKKSLNRPFAGAALPANLAQRPTVARICSKDLGHSSRPRVRQMRKLQGDHFNRFKLIQNYADEVLDGSRPFS